MEGMQDIIQIVVRHIPLWTYVLDILLCRLEKNMKLSVPPRDSRGRFISHPEFLKMRTLGGFELSNLTFFSPAKKSPNRSSIIITRFNWRKLRYDKYDFVFVNGSWNNRADLIYIAQLLKQNSHKAISGSHIPSDLIKSVAHYADVRSEDLLINSSCVPTDERVQTSQMMDRYEDRFPILNCFSIMKTIM